MKSNRIATIASGTGLAALAALVIGTAPAQAAAAYGATAATEAAALDLAMKSIAIRSVIGEGPQPVPNALQSRRCMHPIMCWRGRLACANKCLN